MFLKQDTHHILAYNYVLLPQLISVHTRQMANMKFQEYSLHTPEEKTSAGDSWFNEYMFKGVYESWI